MSTFQELVDRVKSELIDVPVRTSDQIPTFVNQAIRKLQFQHDFSVCKVSTAVLTTVTGARFLANVPSDFLRFRKEQPHVIDNHGRVFNLGVSPGIVQVEREFGSTAGGEFTATEIDGPPQVIVLSEASDVANTRQFHVYPLPDGRSLYVTAPAGEYRIRIPYIRLLPALAGTSSNWFTTNAEEYIVYAAVSIGFFFNQDVPNGQLWFQRAAGEVKDVLARDKYESCSGNSTLDISFDARGPKTPVGDGGIYRGYF